MAKLGGLQIAGKVELQSSVFRHLKSVEFGVGPLKGCEVSFLLVKGFLGGVFRKALCGLGKNKVRSSRDVGDERRVLVSHEGSEIIPDIGVFHGFRSCIIDG